MLQWFQIYYCVLIIIDLNSCRCIYLNVSDSSHRKIKLKYCWHKPSPAFDIFSPGFLSLRSKISIKNLKDCLKKVRTYGRTFDTVNMQLKTVLNLSSGIRLICWNLSPLGLCLGCPFMNVVKSRFFHFKRIISIQFTSDFPSVSLWLLNRKHVAIVWIEKIAAEIGSYLTNAIEIMSVYRMQFM